METGERLIEVVVRGRNVEVPEHFRQHVTDKLARVERYDNKIVRADVELQHEKNRRQKNGCQHIEITCRTRGPVVRAEACAADFYQALELVDGQARAAAAARGRPPPGPPRAAHTDLRRRRDGLRRSPSSTGSRSPTSPTAPNSSRTARAGSCARRSTRPSPMSVDQALFEMELVGHDFYLFADADTGRPTRRLPPPRLRLRRDQTDRLTAAIALARLRSEPHRAPRSAEIGRTDRRIGPDV